MKLIFHVYMFFTGRNGFACIVSFTLYKIFTSNRNRVFYVNLWVIKLLCRL